MRRPARPSRSPATFLPAPATPPPTRATAPPATPSGASPSLRDGRPSSPAVSVPPPLVRARSARVPGSGMRAILMSARGAPAHCPREPRATASGRGCARGSLDVFPDQSVGALGQLDLRHVAAVGEHLLARRGQGVLDVADEAGGGDPVPVAPDEQ